MSNMTGKDLKEFRLKHNPSQSKLADIVGVKVNTVSKWESGIRNIGQSAIKILESHSPVEGGREKERRKESPHTMEDLLVDKLMEELEPLIDGIRKELITKIYSLDLEITKVQEKLIKLEDMTEKVHGVIAKK